MGEVAPLVDGQVGQLGRRRAPEVLVRRLEGGHEDVPGARHVEQRQRQRQHQLPAPEVPDQLRHRLRARLSLRRHRG